EPGPGLDGVLQPLPDRRAPARRFGGQRLLARALDRLLPGACPPRMAAAARGRALHRRGGAPGPADGTGCLATAPRPRRGRTVPGTPALPGGAPRPRTSPDGGGAVTLLELLAGPPVDLEVWLLLGYALVVLAGARVTEALAQMHFRRARRFAEHGFRYD